MAHITLLNLSLLCTLAWIVIVSSRHIQNSEPEAQPDASKSGKPGEYLWYKTGSKPQTERKVAKSFIAKVSHDKVDKQPTVDSDEDQELNSGAIPNYEEKDLSGSGEPNEEYMSGSGSYPTSYMVDIDAETGTNNPVEPDSDTPTEDLATSGQDKQEEENADFSGENKDEDAGKEAENSEQVKEQDNSGSGNVEQEDENDEDTDRNEKVKIVSAAVAEHVASPAHRRSGISKKSKDTKGNSESEYDKLFKDFKNDGDLGLQDDDDDGDFNDNLSDEETKQLVSEGNKEEPGRSKSAITRHGKEGENLSSMFQDFSDDSNNSPPSEDESRDVKLTKLKKNIHGSKMKEILSKLDSDIFRGKHSKEHVQHHSKKHRDYHKHHHNHLHHQQQHNETANETIIDADTSRALSHHADDGIFNGSVSNVTLEAQKVKKQQHHKQKHYHHHHHHHHHRHQHQIDIEAHKDNISENVIPEEHLQNHSDAQYSAQSPSYPFPSSGPVVNAEASQIQPYPEEMSLYQIYQQPTNGYEYHAVKYADSVGAVCLDGSTPGYYLRKGSGEGSNKWIIYLQGGAWCDSKETCLGRSRMHLGSSLFYKPLGNPGGILSNNIKLNPKFHNWNVAYLPYCDGSSFSGNRSDPVEVESSLLYFRGFRILDTTISELLSDMGLQQAERVVFSGTSAGGLAVMLHADFVRSKLPNTVHFRALADSGFFLDTASRKTKGHRDRKFRKTMQNVFKLHDCTDGVPKSCVDDKSGKKLWKCIFPQYFLNYVKSPLFIVNPLYDSWQLGHIWEIPCASKPYSCTKKEVKQIKKFRKTTMKALKRVVLGSPNIALFADSCMDHGQVINAQWNSIKVMHKSISWSFAKWCDESHSKDEVEYFIDEDDYPANPTCITKDLDKRSEIFTEGF